MGGVVTAPVCRDAVIVIPGIMGSELVDVETGDVLWGLSPRSYLRLWTSGAGLKRLRVTDRERVGKTGRIRATGLLRFPVASPIFGGFEPYTRLVSAIRRSLTHPDALCEFAYDWRLPVAFNAARLGDVVEAHLRRWRAHRMGSKDANVVLVAHSMGGLVARCFAGPMGGASAVRQTVTLGTPFFGAVKAAYLLNVGRGVPVWLPRARLRELALTLPGVHDLLPSYRCVDDAGGRPLTPADVADFGGDSELAEAAFAMQHTLAKLGTDGLRTVVGVDQPTMQSMRLVRGVVLPQRHIAEAGVRTDHRGDGTVYVEAALGGVEPVSYLPQSHAGLSRAPEAIAAVVAVLTRQRLGPPMGGKGVGLEVPDLAIVGERCEAKITASDDAMPSCRVVDSETGEQVDAPEPVRRDGQILVAIRMSAAGLYRVEVKTGGYSAVTALIMALPPGDVHDGSR
jgi:pimeloyl-ACP methyl ester carboxylesterase